MRYFLYARKSTDVEDKRVLSIESQLAELRALAKNEGLEVAKEFVEKRSAKMPGRPVSSEMMARIQKSETRWRAPFAQAGIDVTKAVSRGSYPRS